MNYPERIICLTEETTELLYLLGEENRIAGITVYTVRPERAKKEKPTVSAFISGNIKKIKSLYPDLVIGFSDIQAQLAHDLIKEGMNVFITNQRSIEEIFQTMLWIGSLVGRTEDTKVLVQTWRDKLKRIRKESEIIIREKWEGKRPKVFFQEWNEPLITGIQWVSEIISICGGTDAFPHLQKNSLAKDRIIQPQDVVSANPDIIIGSWCGKPVDFDWISNQSGWNQTNALKRNRNYEVDSSIILQPGPALFLDGVDRIRELVHSFRVD